MRFKQNVCPKCGSPAGKIIERVLVGLGLAMDEETGKYDYGDGGDDPAWETSEPHLNERGEATLACSHCSQEWQTEILADCEGCDGSGIRPNSDNGEDIVPPDGFVVVERCDACGRYPDDLAAAKAYGASAIWQAADDDTQQVQAICVPRTQSAAGESPRPSEN